MSKFLFQLGILSLCLSTSLAWTFPPSSPPGSSFSRSTIPKRRLSMYGMSTQSQDYDPGCVANARMAVGLEGVLLRCASTDPLATKVQDQKDPFSPVEQAILQQSGLILDLRSPSERNESQAQTWMSSSTFQAQEINLDSSQSLLLEESSLQDLTSRCPKLVLRLDILSPSKFMNYLEQHWLSGPNQIKANIYKLMDGGKLHELRMQTLNEKGLLGLNQAILETGNDGIRIALKAITLYLERQLLEPNNNNNNNNSNNNQLVVIHCVQGKDRTGLLVMLCQSLLGVSEEQIIEDYYKSHYHKDRAKRKKETTTENSNEDTSAAMERATSTTAQRSATKLDRSIFHSAPREVMAETLQYCKQTYGSVAPGYLNHIGFDSTWQRRFQQAMAALSTTTTENTANVLADEIHRSKL